jgi:hypothetical protein
MRVIDKSPYRDESGSIELNDRMRGIWKHGLAWNKESQAQDKLSDRLQVQLDNNYTLIRDVVLPGLSLAIPMVLIGPTGIRVFYPSGIRGIYRAKETSWSEMDNKGRYYRPAQPNLIKRTAILSRALHTFLTSKGYQIEDIEPVLYLSDSSVHVDAKNPAVRIVLTDGADRYIENFSQDIQVLDIADVKRITDTLAEIRLDPQTPLVQKKLSIGSMQMYRWQWLILGVLVVLLLCMMLVFILLIFMVT